MLRSMAKAREKYNEEKTVRNAVSIAAAILTIINLAVLARAGFDQGAMSSMLVLMAAPSLAMYYIADGISVIMRVSRAAGKILGGLIDILCIPFFLVGLGNIIYVILGPMTNVVTVLFCFAAAIMMPGVVIPCMNGIRRMLGGFEISEGKEKRAVLEKA